MKHCYTYVQSKNVIGIIRYGETGYYKTDLLESNKILTANDAVKLVDELNDKLGLTKGEVNAMEFGSLFGWNVPAADPGHWNADGTLK